MEAPRLEPGRPVQLRLLERRLEIVDTAPAGLAPWTLLFGALAASAGHGVFLLAALTRLARVPSRAELGGPLELAVLGWFVAALPLALASVLLRPRFLRWPRRAAWSVSAGAAALAVAAFALYVRAIALA